MATVSHGKLDESDLKQLIDTEINQAKDYGWSIKEQREESMRYYYGEAFGNEVDGRSKIILHEVQDVIELVMPQLMEIFTSGDQFGKFEPESKATPEQRQKAIEEAEQATDVVEHIFMRENDGFTLTYDGCKDGLMVKTGIFKTWFDDSETVTAETYTGLDEFGFQKLLIDPEVTFKQHSTREVPASMLEDEEDFDVEGQGVEMPENEIITVHDLRVERKVQTGSIKVEVVPPEEFYITNRSRSDDKNDSPFMAHRTEMTVQEMIAMDYPLITKEKLIDISGDDDQEYDIELIARFSKDETYTSVDIQDSPEPLMRRVWVTEAYLFVDWDDDGHAEYRKVTKAGDVILENIEVDDHPFVTMCPVRIAHKFYGLSLSDLVMDIQLIKSTIFRNILDNAYLQNNQRTAVDAGNVNLDDFLTSRPHGLLRVEGDPRTRMMPVTTPQLPESTFTVLEHLDKIRDQRTGVNEYMSGVNPEVLQKTTLGAFSQASSMAQSRVALIARLFAETGFKKLYLKIYALFVKNQNKPKTFRLRGKWHTVDPSSWRERTDFTVNVGLGHGTKQENLANLEKVGAGLRLLRSDPALKDMVTKKNIYKLAVKTMQFMGIKNFDDFITDPGDKPEPKGQGQGGDPAAMAKAQADTMKAQAALQKVKVDMERLELEKKEMALEAKREAEELRFEREQHQWEKQKFAMEMKMEQLEHQLKVKELNVEYLTNKSVAVGDT